MSSTYTHVPSNVAGTGAPGPLSREFRNIQRSFDAVSAGMVVVRHDGSGDATTAIRAAWNTVIETGGVLVFPPGDYTKSQPIVFDYAANPSATVLVLAYGARIHDTAAVTGYSFTVTGSQQPHGISIQGLTGAYTDNTTVQGLLDIQGASHAAVVECVVELPNTQISGFAPFRCSPVTPGNDDTNSFWTTFERCKTRQLTGGSAATRAPYGIRLLGTANATRVLHCEFGHCVVAVGATTDGVGTALANGIVIDGNAFEGVTTAVSMVATPGQYWAPGWRVCNNRIESVTNFFSMTTGGAAANNHSSPPFLYGNYGGVGSVTTWVENPTDAYVSCLDPSFYGTVPPIRVQTQGPFRLPMSGGNLLLTNLSGQPSYAEGHVQFGEDTGGAGHLWVEGGTGTIRYKFGTTPPTSALDGSQIAVSGNSFPVSGTSPRVEWDETDGAVDEKWCDLVLSAGLLKLRLLDDSKVAGDTAWQIVRVGTTMNRMLVGAKLWPITDAASDLGDSTAQWRHLYLSGKVSLKASGAAACAGTAVLVGGTVTVSTTAIASTTLVGYAMLTPGGGVGNLTVTRSNGVSFTLTSSSGTDTSTYQWWFIETH